MPAISVSRSEAVTPGVTARARTAHRNSRSPASASFVEQAFTCAGVGRPVLSQRSGQPWRRGGVRGERTQPFQQRGPRIRCPGQFAGAGAQSLNPLAEDRLEQRASAGEVSAYGGRADPRHASDMLQGGVGAVRGDLLLGRGEDARVVASGIRTLGGYDVTSGFAKRRSPPYRTKG